MGKNTKTITAALIFFLISVCFAQTSGAAMDYTVEKLRINDDSSSLTYDRINITNQDVEFVIVDHNNCEFNEFKIRECVFNFNLTKNQGKKSNLKLRTNLPYDYTINTVKQRDNKNWDRLDSTPSQYELRFTIGDNDSGKFDVYFYHGNTLIATLDPTYGCGNGNGNHAGNPCDTNFCSSTCPCNPLENFGHPWDTYTCHIIIAAGDTGCSYGGQGNCGSDSDCWVSEGSNTTGLQGYCAYHYGATWGCSSSVNICVFLNQTSSSSSSSSSSIASLNSGSSSSESSSSSAASTTSSSLASSSSSSSLDSSSSSSSYISSMGSTSSSSISSSSSSSSAVSSSNAIVSSSDLSSSSSSSSSMYDSTSSSALSSSSSQSSSVASSTPTTLYYGQTFSTDCSEYYYYYRYNITVGSNVYAFDFKNISNQLLVGMKNVNVSRGAGQTITGVYYNTTNPGVLVVSASPYLSTPTQGENELTFYIYGLEKNYAYSSNHPAITTSVEPSTNDMSRNANTYAITLKNEKTNALWNYTNITNMTMDVKCADYSDYILDLKALNTPYVYLSTRQSPSVQVNVNQGAHQREVMLQTQAASFWLLPYSFDKVIKYFSLVDYTRQFIGHGPYLLIRKRIGSEYGTIFSRVFENDNMVSSVELMPCPGCTYNIDVCNDGGLCYSLGQITALNNDTVATVLSLLTPVLGAPIGNYGDLTVYLTANYATNTITAYYNDTTPGSLITASLIVYNTSGNYTETYRTSLTSSSGSLSFTSPWNNSFYALIEVNTTLHPTFRNGYPIDFSPQPTTIGPMNMTNMPNTLMGRSMTDWKLLLSYIIIVTFLLAGGKAISLGVGLITADLVYFVLYMFEWIPHTIPAWLWLVFFIISCGVVLAERRAEGLS